MSVRKRQWTTSKGEPRESWVVNYTDPQGKRRLKTFKRKKQADSYAAGRNGRGRARHAHSRPGEHDRCRRW
jgi:hypothetical protein